MNKYIEFLKLTILKAFNINPGNKIKLSGYTIHFGSIKQLKLLYKEIFLKENYFFAGGNDPYIIDGGANIGLAILYFKKICPNCRIIAFEPNKESFELLKKNIDVNKLSNIDIYNAALSDNTKTTTFYTSSNMQSADIGASAVKEHVNYHHSTKGTLQVEKVESEILSSFIDQKVDLLKLDIEGFEGRVMKEIEDKFHFIKNSIMEYHYSSSDTENNFSGIIKIYESNNHEYQIIPVDKSKGIKSVTCYMLKSRSRSTING